MPGVGIHIDQGDLEQLKRDLENLPGQGEQDLLEVVGAAIESQTRRRIADEKTTPDGEPWPDWSDRYARTRHSGHSLLVGQGDLLDSIGFVIGPGQVQVGSNLIYAATHHYGDPERGIPARQWLGLSASDEAELKQIIIDWYKEIMP